MRAKVQLPSPVTGENRAGATLEVGDQCLFHGERTVAMSTGQASGQHITFRNELEGILFRGLMFTFQMNPQGLTTNCFLTQGAFILLHDSAGTCVDSWYFSRLQVKSRVYDCRNYQVDQGLW